jgi:hypothetical protein
VFDDVCMFIWCSEKSKMRSLRGRASYDDQDVVVEISNSVAICDFQC